MAYLCFYSAEGRGEGGEKVKQYLQLSCFQKGKRNRVHEKMRAEGSERGRGAEPSGAPSGDTAWGVRGAREQRARRAVCSQHGAEHGRQGLPTAERAELTRACGALRAAGGARRVLPCVTVLGCSRALTGVGCRSVLLCQLAHGVAPTWLHWCVFVCDPPGARSAWSHCWGWEMGR